MGFNAANIYFPISQSKSNLSTFITIFVLCAIQRYMTNNKTLSVHLVLKLYLELLQRQILFIWIYLDNLYWITNPLLNLSWDYNYEVNVTTTRDFIHVLFALDGCLFIAIKHSFIHVSVCWLCTKVQSLVIFSFLSS